MYTLLMGTPGLPPHLVELNGIKCCSVCKKAFDASSTPFVSAPFKKHDLEDHKTPESKRAA
jgi:hypothetical protein